jgi:type IV pilus assembly protein PilQ
MRQVLHILFLVSIAFAAFGQEKNDSTRLAGLAYKLDLILADNPGLEEPVDVSVSEVPLAEFIRAIGLKNKVNLSVDEEVKGLVTNTFSQVTVKEVLLFLAKEYQLDLQFSGSIISVLPLMPESPQPNFKIPNALAVDYDTSSSFISMDLKQDTLSKVARFLTQLTGKNLVFNPEVGKEQVSIYLENVAFDQAMDKLAYANNLQIKKTEDEFYLIEKLNTPQANQPSQERPNRFLDFKRRDAGQIQVDSNGISLNFEDEPIMSLLEKVFQSIGVQFFLYEDIPGTATLNFKGIKINQLLGYLFDGTDYTFRPSDSIYLIGNKAMEGLKEVRRVNLRNRTVDRVKEYLPKSLLQDVEVKEVPELNGLILSGSFPEVQAIETFIQSIDQAVPVVIIEVIIVDYQRNFNVSTGIEAGIGDQPAGNSGGGVYPGIDYSLNAQSINQIIQSFNGFGTLNLGPVTPNFYMNLKFLETNGFLNVRSTPKLSTLNGYEATLSIGNTEYYVVEQINIQGVQNPIPTTTRNYQSVEANFTLTIKPMVSANDQVTLEIEVEQSDFTARISPEAPPGNVSRKFSSLIRVKNNEIILLGGLEEKSYNDSGSGLPLLSRIPVLKWLFSSRNRTDSKSKLNVFIKPTIIK